MEITIVGAGAIGGTVGAHLLEAGQQVRFVDSNEDHVRAIREQGLRIHGRRELHVYPEAFTPDDMPDKLGVTFLAVKSRHTDGALQSIAPRLAPDGYVLSLQNGLEEYKIAAAVGQARTVGAFLTFGGHYVGPGEIAYGGPGSFRVGEMDGQRSGRVGQLRDTLAAFHPVEVTNNIFGYLWSKLAVSSFWFATALVNADVPDIIADARYQGLLGRMVAEVVGLAQSMGVRPEVVDGFDPNVFPLRGEPIPDDAARCWAAEHAYWTSHDAGDGYQRTGIWRDLAIYHRPTEATRMAEELIAPAHERGMSLPRLERVVEMIHEAEEGRRGLGWGNLEELRRLDQKWVAG